MFILTVWRNARVLRLGLALACGSALLLGLLLTMGTAHTPEDALAQGSTIRYVAPAPAGDDSGNDCMNGDTPCATIQHAVDMADAGDEIRVASGTYTAAGSNVVTITKSITIIGGFEPPDWTTSVSSTTTKIDGERARRGIEVQGTVTATIANLTVTRGRAGMGGGLYLGSTSGRVDISNVKFEDNESLSTYKNDGGGGLYAWGDVTLSNTEIISNYARKQAGGLYIRGKATLIETTVLSNTTQNIGGGLYSQKKVTVTSSLFKNNVTLHKFPSLRGGGGMWVYGQIVLSGTQVVSNISAQDGGGIYLADGVLTMTNVIIARNRADRAGSGLYITDSLSSKLVHTTIAHNLGDAGSGIHITGTSSTVALTNTVLVSHRVGITVTGGNTVTVNGVLWYSNTINYGGLGTVTVTNAYTGDPAFAADGYHLTAFSAAIDKGVNAGVDNDIDGDPRPVDGDLDTTVIPDIGADEFLPNASLAVTKRADPDGVQLGSPLTYTLHVTNTGNVTLNATITDLLPRWVTPSGTLTWTPVVIAPGGVWTETVVVTPELGSCWLTNKVEVTTDEGPTDSYTEISKVVGSFCRYLPLILKNATANRAENKS